MKIIQFILIPLLAGLVVLYFRQYRSLLLDRMIVLGLGIVGSILVAMPDLSTSIARFFGVGRGVDLVIYLGLVGVCFLCLVIYSRLRKLEAELTSLVRSHAIEHAKKSGDRVL